MSEKDNLSKTTYSDLSRVSPTFRLIWLILTVGNKRTKGSPTCGTSSAPCPVLTPLLLLSDATTSGVSRHGTRNVPKGTSSQQQLTRVCQWQLDYCVTNCVQHVLCILHPSSMLLYLRWVLLLLGFSPGPSKLFKFPKLWSLCRPWVDQHVDGRSLRSPHTVKPWGKSLRILCHAFIRQIYGLLLSTRLEDEMLCSCSCT